MRNNSGGSLKIGVGRVTLRRGIFGVHGDLQTFNLDLDGVSVLAVCVGCLCWLSILDLGTGI